VGFLLIALVLTHTLFKISQDRHISNTIEKVLIEELADLPSASFDKMIYEKDDDKLYVLAHAYAATVISPNQVSRIQDRLAKELNETTELTIQSKIAHNVAALGTLSQVKATDLDGNFIKTDPHPRVLKTKAADTIIRNYLSDKPNAALISVRLMQRDKYSIIFATIGGIAKPDDETMEQMEALLREKLEDPTLRFFVQYLPLDLYDREGRMRFELTGFADLNSDQEKVVAKAKAAFENRFESDPDFSLYGIDYTLIDGTLYFFLDVVGSRVFSQNGVAELERLVFEKTGQPVKLHALSRIETVATSKGYESYRALSSRIFQKLEPKLREDMEEIIRRSNL
jgi:hypothetical protein